MALILRKLRLSEPGGFTNWPIWASSQAESDQGSKRKTKNLSRAYHNLDEKINDEAILFGEIV